MSYFLMMILALLLIPWKTTEFDKKTLRLTVTDTDLRYTLSFIIIFFFSAFRYGVGTDYFFTYVPGFLILRDGIYTYDYYEKGFEIINRFCMLLTDNYQSVFIVTSLIIYGLFYFLLKRFSECPRLSVYIYFSSSMYFNSLSNIRQAISMMICLTALYIWKVSYIDIEQDCLKAKLNACFKFYFLVLLAFSIHSSAIVFSIVPLLGCFSDIKLKDHVLIATIVTFAILFAKYFGIIDNGLRWALTYLERYQRYQSTGTIYWSFLALNIVIYILMYLSSINCSKGLLDKKYSALYLNIQFTTIILLLISDILPWADRISRYFMLCQCFSIPYLLKNIKRKNIKSQVCALFVVVYFAWFVFYICKYGADGCFPYKSVFSVDSMWQKNYFGY